MSWMVFLVAAVAAAMLYFLIGIIVDLENEKVVRARKELIEKFNDLRRMAREEGVAFNSSMKIDLGEGLVFSAEDIGFSEEHILAGVEQNIAEGKQDPVCRMATDENLRSCVLRFYLLHWPEGITVLRGHRVMLRIFRERVEETLPRQLQLLIAKKKMLERRAY